jgi:hypothetical protein
MRDGVTLPEASTQDEDHLDTGSVGGGRLSLGERGSLALVEGRVGARIGGLAGSDTRHPTQEN